jgi:hypothetical protein
VRPGKSLLQEKFQIGYGLRNVTCEMHANYTLVQADERIKLAEAESIVQLRERIASDRNWDIDLIVCRKDDRTLPPIKCPKRLE